MFRKNSITGIAICATLAVACFAGCSGAASEGSNQRAESVATQENSAEESSNSGDSDAAFGSIKIGVLRTADSVPLYVAQEDGLYEEYGVNVELIEFGSASDQSKAAEAGSLDMMMTDMIVQTLIGKGGVPMRTVRTALGADPTEGKFMVVASPQSELTGIENIEGKSIAISENTMMEYLVDSYLEELGIDESAITKVNIPSLSLRFESLISGSDIDSAILPDPLGDYAVSKGGVSIIDDTQLSGNYSISVIAATDSFIDENSEALEKFLAAYDEAVDHINEDGTSYKNLVFEVASVPEDMQDSYQVPTYPKSSLPEEEPVESLQSWMVKKDLIDEALDYESVVYIGK